MFRTPLVLLCLGGLAALSGCATTELVKESVKAAGPLAEDQAVAIYADWTVFAESLTQLAEDVKLPLAVRKVAGSIVVEGAPIMDRMLDLSDEVRALRPDIAAHPDLAGKLEAMLLQLDAAIADGNAVLAKAAKQSTAKPGEST